METKELIYKDDARRAILKADTSIAYCIDNIKPVDAKAVVCGEWIPIYNTYYNQVGEWQIADEWYCSKCEIHSRSKSNYCPNCGADMRGVEDG